MKRIKKRNRREKALKQFNKEKRNLKSDAIFSTGFNTGWESCKKEFGKILFISSLPEEVVKGLNSALEDLKAGRYTVLVNDKEESTPFTEKKAK